MSVAPRSSRAFYISALATAAVLALSPLGQFESAPSYHDNRRAMKPKASKKKRGKGR